MRVLVAGAGLAGLSAAVSLRRAGHIVHVYERSCMNNEVGAAINVPPNATRFLTAWGLDPVKWRFVKSRIVTFNNPFSTELETTALVSKPDTASGLGGASLYYAHRVDLHNALKWMATREDGPGTPATIHLGADVVGYDTSTPSITLANGDVITGDLVVGADGVHSAASEAVLGRTNEPIAPEHSNYVYRFLIPAEVLEDDPETRFWNEERDGWTRIFTDNETKRRMVIYTCRDNTVHNFVGLVYETSKEGEVEDWRASVPVSDVLKSYDGFSPRLLKIFSKAAEVKRWRLLYRNPIPTWHKDRMVLAGDSAHPMLPHQAQGGAQGLEDGVALGMVLHGASTPDEITKRLGIYESVRRNRASAIQILSNVGQDQIHLVHDELRAYMKPGQMPNNPGDIFKYTFGFDVVWETLQAMKEYDASFELPTDFFEGEVIGVPSN